MLAYDLQQEYIKNIKLKLKLSLNLVGNYQLYISESALFNNWTCFDFITA